MIMPEFSQHELEIQRAAKYDVTVVKYNEKLLVQRKFSFYILLPFLIILSSLGLLNYYKCVFYLRDYSKLNDFLTKKIAKTNLSDFETIIWVKIAGVDDRLLTHVKQNTSARMVVFLYDPLLRYPDVSSKLKFFDASYTFDPRDSHLYSLEYLPMFAVPERDRALKHKVSKTDDVIYIGSFTLQRLLTLVLLKLILRNKKTQFILVNTALFNLNIFGVQIQNTLVSDDRLMLAYQKARVMLELRDTDQSGYSKRKNDSAVLKVHFISITCVGFNTLLRITDLKRKILDLRKILRQIDTHKADDTKRFDKEANVLEPDDFLDLICNDSKQK